jgi:DNA-binding IclR family transcriptional regulator
MVDPNTRRYSAPALEKGLDIIELLSDASTSLTMTEIGSRLGRSKSQIFRNLRILEERGYIALRNGGDQFSLTNKLFQMGLRGPPAANLIETAYPVMTEVSRALDQSIHLGIASREQMVVVARVENPGDVVLTVPVSHRRVLSESASGRVLLAFQAAPIRTAWLKLVATASKERFEAAALEARLAAIREQGYELSASAGVQGVTDISFPLFDSGGNAIAAMTTPLITRLTRPIDAREAVAVLRDAAERINSALAAGPSRA